MSGARNGISTSRGSGRSSKACYSWSTKRNNSFCVNSKPENVSCGRVNLGGESAFAGETSISMNQACGGVEFAQSDSARIQTAPHSIGQCGAEAFARQAMQ